MTGNNRSATSSFAQQVRHVLEHLYDSAELYKSPLIEALALTGNENAAASLRHILIEAIELLKPVYSMPPDAEDWRFYRILYHRYVDRFPQGQVADNLGLGVRQLRREELRAVEVLSETLHARHLLLAQDAPRLSTRERELAWVGNSFPHEMTDPHAMIEEVLQTIEPLARSHQVRLRFCPQEALPELILQRNGVKQALVTVLSVAVRCATFGWIDLHTLVDERELKLTICSKPGQLGSRPLDQGALDSLEIGRQLVSLSGGSLDVQTDTSQEFLRVTCSFSATMRESILFIDDNVDALRLFERYLVGTPYRFLCARDADSGLKLAVTTVPQVIVLDIMLPGVDGWRLLERLREHTAVCNVPIIVCSILPQDDLAWALGAAGFLRKPVKRQLLLSMLDRLLAEQAPTNR